MYKFYIFQCNPGYAGNGDYCQLDSDNDGLPDSGIGSCSVWGCAMVRVLVILGL